MSSINSILTDIHNRIDYLRKKEIEYKKVNNISGRLNAKTRRQELQLLVSIICDEHTDAIRSATDGVNSL